MRRTLLGLLVVLLLSPVAGAVVGGIPDSAQITALFGTVQVNGVPISAPFTLSNSTGRGTADKITMTGTGAVVEVTFSFNSAQSAYSATASGTNLLVILGTATQPATDPGAGIRLLDIAWSTDGGSSYTPSPAPASLGPVTVTGNTPATTYAFSFANPPAPAAAVDRVRIRFANIGIASTNSFYLATIQNPEPGTMALFGAGLLGAGILVVRRRRRRRA